MIFRPGMVAIGFAVLLVCSGTAAEADEPAGKSADRAVAVKDDAKRPHILWILLEDWGPDLSCYGTRGVQTPHIDQLAAEGIRFTRAFTTAPVCSSSRSAMLTGHYQNYTGTHQHRTEEEDKKPLPHGIVPLPALLRDAGYFTAVGCGMGSKTDHNFTDPVGFVGAHWRQRTAGQPFFAQVTEGGTHRLWNRDPERPIAADQVDLPPYYPDVPLIRRDWANGLEQAQLSDRRVGKLLAELEADGLADETIVILVGDHGRCMPRGKQFLYDGGIHVPLIIRWPGEIPAGSVCDDLVSSLDICKTIVDLAGVVPPHPLHGMNLLGDDIKHREYLFAARDKMDSTHDAMRAVRSRDYKYILNLMPERAYCQFNSYKERSYPTLAMLQVMHQEGKLNPVQAAFLADHKPREELYDLRRDPWETKNLAEDPEYAEIKAAHAAALAAWRQQVHDAPVSDTFRRGGWPATYPTRSLEQWREVVALWEPWVFRAPTAAVGHPRNVIKDSSPLAKKNRGKP